MAARAMWKGRVRIGAESLGVKLYAAATDRRVRFHLLHKKDLARVRQRMAHPLTGETVEREAMRRGVEVERGLFVLVEQEELAALEPEPSRDLELVRCVPPARIDHRWYERPYHLGPDDGQDRRYHALVRALEDEGVEALVRWTMRKRPYVGALAARQGRLALVTLRSADEVLDASRLAPPEGRALDARELELAAQLVGALAAPFDASAFHDEHRERVLALVEAKRRGESVRPRRFRARKIEDDSLADVLERSLRAAG